MRAGHARLVAGSDLQPGVDERTVEPRPDGSLVIGAHRARAASLTRPAGVMRNWSAARTSSAGTLAPGTRASVSRSRIRRLRSALTTSSRSSSARSALNWSTKALSRSTAPSTAPGRGERNAASRRRSASRSSYRCRCTACRPRSDQSSRHRSNASGSRGFGRRVCISAHPVPVAIARSDVGHEGQVVAAGFGLERDRAPRLASTRFDDRRQRAQPRRPTWKCAVRSVRTSAPTGSRRSMVRAIVDTFAEVWLQA